MAAGFWYGDDESRRRAVRVLEAMRAYRAADEAMRRRTRQAMGMGENDLLALRYVLRAEGEQRTVAPKDLASYLGISSASTTVLLDRLERSGHLCRTPSLVDRRAVLVEATPAAHTEVRATLADLHDRMLAAVDSLDDDQTAAVLVFLERMRAAVDGVARAKVGQLPEARYD